MSVEATAAVWAMRGLDGPEKLVAVRLADHADPDGRNAFPSVARLAADTGQSVRTVQRTLRDLLRKRVITQHGAGPHGTRRFTVNMGWQSDTPDTESPPAERHPVTESGVPDSPAGGDSQSLAGVSERHPNRKRTVSEPSKARRATTAPDSFDITDAMRSWASERGITPTVNLDSETERWLDHHRAKGSLFKDWTAAWRTWMSRAKDYAPKNGNGGRMRPAEQNASNLNRVAAAMGVQR